jgi:hypothetical protein
MNKKFIQFLFSNLSQKSEYIFCSSYEKLHIQYAKFIQRGHGGAALSGEIFCKKTLRYLCSPEASGVFLITNRNSQITNFLLQCHHLFMVFILYMIVPVYM